MEAVDGKDALTKLTGPVNLVITDLNMPNLDGIGLIRRLRANPACKGMPIVMLTTESQESRKQEGKAAGATGWIVKPFTHAAASGGGEEADRMNLDRHQQAFQDEARELLVELESALLELDQKREDPEVVGAGFPGVCTPSKDRARCSDSSDISGFAHHLESAFDQLRKGQLAVTSDLINLSLAAGDQMKKMLDGGRGRRRRRSRTARRTFWPNCGG